MRNSLTQGHFKKDLCKYIHITIAGKFNSDMNGYVIYMINALKTKTILGESLESYIKRSLDYTINDWIHNYCRSYDCPVGVFTAATIQEMINDIYVWLDARVKKELDV